MRITELYRLGRPIFSFEFFPPKSDAGARQLMRTVGELREMLAPDLVSVTYGAGGSTRRRTVHLVQRIQAELGLTTMAHLTCSGQTIGEVRVVLKELIAGGVANVLALRGDPPRGETLFAPTEGGFAHASELAAFVRENFDVAIAGACYPECHPETSSVEEELKWTLHKVRSGVEVLITQLFFDNEDYFRFTELARETGVDVPIVPGIMPITQVAQIEHNREDPGAVMAIGIEHAIAQCRELLDRGVPGIHFYTLNKSHATRSVLAAIRSLCR
jgi:methylenetetrahydrofolate reductase (NADPH)